MIGPLKGPWDAWNVRSVPNLSIVPSLSVWIIDFSPLENSREGDGKLQVRKDFLFGSDMVHLFGSLGQRSWIGWNIESSGSKRAGFASWTRRPRFVSRAHSRLKSPPTESLKNLLQVNGQKHLWGLAVVQYHYTSIEYSRTHWWWVDEWWIGFNDYCGSPDRIL